MKMQCNCRIIAPRELQQLLKLAKFSSAAALISGRYSFQQPDMDFGYFASHDCVALPPPNFAITAFMSTPSM
jgi:hypothetical protein